jgi:thioredoxin 1
MPRWRKLAPDEVVDAIGDGVVMLDFFQASCPPCHALEPRLEAFARRHHGELEVLQIDIDENAATPGRFGIMSIPTLILFRDGRELARLDGLIRDEDLERVLEEDNEA